MARKIYHGIFVKLLGIGEDGACPIPVPRTFGDGVTVGIELYWFKARVTDFDAGLVVFEY